MKLPSSLAAIAMFALASSSFAGATRTYQVTGPILEMNDTMVAVQKGKERWEVARDASTKANGAMKVGDKVTITYTMTATGIELKGAAGDTAQGSKPPVPSPAAAKR